MKSSTQPKPTFKKSYSAPNFSNPDNSNKPKIKKPYVPKTSTPKGNETRNIEEKRNKERQAPKVPQQSSRDPSGFHFSASGSEDVRQSRNTSKGGETRNSKIKTPKIILEFKNEEERIKFTELKTKYPHICMPLTVKKIQSIQNIDGFDVLLTDEWIELQKEGWEFLKIMKPDQLEDPPESNDYRLEPLNNRWGDFVLFKKV